jgi:hypothetical protein
MPVKDTAYDTTASSSNVKRIANTDLRLNFIPDLRNSHLATVYQPDIKIYNVFIILIDMEPAHTRIV